MREPSGARWLRGAEGALFGAALVLLGVYVYARVDAALYGSVQDRRLDHAMREGPARAGPSRIVGSAVAGAGREASAPALAARAVPSANEPPAADGRDGLIGRLEAPRLGLRAVVSEGTDARTLRRGVGHVPGTAAPGDGGNVALAAHRDGVFRVLERVRPGDTLRLTTPTGAYEYVVDSAEVVEPDRTDVLAPTPEPMLTLVTCYPFYMIGPAPQRFVVRARQLASARQGGWPSRGPGPTSITALTPGAPRD